jgi:hypothetical protein
MKDARSMLTNYLVNKEDSPVRPFRSGVGREIGRRERRIRGWFATCALFLLCWGVPVHAGWLKPDVDYSNYQTPLADQIVNRIRAKILARLGPGESRQDRYFIIPFAYQDRSHRPDSSHSFISVIRVFADQKQPKYTPGLRRGRDTNRKFEAFTISWVPHDFLTNTHLCVFDRLGSRIFPSLETCSPVAGRNCNLFETLKLAVNLKVAVGMWGPYEIKKVGFDLGVRRKQLLDEGKIRYIADDRLYRKDGVAINCFHAMGNLEQLYPNGGFLGSGWQMWGIDGTARILIEYTKAARYTGLILEPVDYKKDLYGFVYAPAPNSFGVYNPFRNASAYHD